jgi:hypothetical protein
VKKLYAQITGIGFLVLTLVGVFVDGKILSFINTDPNIDAIRLFVALFLLYAGFYTLYPHTRERLITLVGFTELVFAIWALTDNQLSGLAPHGWTPFDISFHFVVGLITYVIGMYDYQFGPSHHIHYPAFRHH